MIDRVCTCGADPRFTHVCDTSAPLGTFTALPAAEFERLIERGAESAREFDALIAPMFGLGSHGSIVLRSRA